MFLTTLKTAVTSRSLASSKTLLLDLNSTNRLWSTISIKQKYCNSVGDHAGLNEESISKKGGFAKAFDKFSIQEEKPKEEQQSFLSLLKNSKFVDLGDPEGKVVIGTIFQVVGDDLYVDFGWKFHCVVTRPAKNGHEYVRGARVRLIVKELELSTRFLGSEKDLTLLEADATLIGLVRSPARPGNDPSR